jgi:hypothetical protein
MTHTPEPWVVGWNGDTGDYDDGLGVVAVARGGICDMGPRIRPDEEILANARLIAAAPDLLEACETALTVLDQLQQVEELFQESWNVNLARRKLEAARDKAKGE